MISCPRHPAPTMRASPLYAVLVQAIVLGYRRLLLEYVYLQLILHEHQWLHRILFLWQAQSRCSHPEEESIVIN